MSPLSEWLNRRAVARVAMAADKAEYAAKAGPELDACFKEGFRIGARNYQIVLNSAGGLALIRHLAKHGFAITRIGDDGRS